MKYWLIILFIIFFIDVCENLIIFARYVGK